MNAFAGSNNNNNNNNNSLVFGGDDLKTSSTNADNNSLGASDKSTVSTNNNCRFSLVDKPDETPFLQRLQDPFETTVIMSGSLFSEGRPNLVPPPPGFDSTHDITKCRRRELQLLQLSPWKKLYLDKGTVADTQVISRNKSVFEDTQVIEHNNTGNNNAGSNDAGNNSLTQRIRCLPDRLELSPERSLVMAHDDNDIVVVSNPEAPRSKTIMGPTQMDDDNDGDGDKGHFLSMETPTQLRLTQKVLANPTAGEITDIFDTLAYQPDANDSLGQIRFLASHREVPNTQDSILDAVGNVVLEVEEDEDVEEEDIEIVSDDEAVSRNNSLMDTQKIHMTQKTTLAPSCFEHQPLILGLGSPTVISDSSPTANKQFRTGTSQIPDTSNTQVIKTVTLLPSSPTLKHEEAKIDFGRHAKDEKTFTDDQEEIMIPNTYQRKHKFVIDSQNEEGPFKRARASPESPELLREEPLTVMTEKDILHKGSVWALYNVRVYSGVLLSLGEEVLEVEFEEGTYQIKNEDLHLLDIRIGDTIRVKSKVARFTVSGLKKTHNDTNSICCVRGYNSVLLKRQNTKTKSFPEIEVPLSECWMEIGDLMNHHQGNAMLIKGRSRSQFESFGELCDVIADIDVGCSSPLNANNITSNNTAVIDGSSPVKGHKSRSSPIKSIRSEETKLFSGRLFVITSVSGNKQALCDVILRNGGSILESFEKHLRCVADDQGVCIVIDGQLAHFRFACVLSTSYCRSAKYLQALALGWPVVSDAYIFDTIRNPGNLESWCAYLLPSGKSKYLGDAVKSMDIYPFRKNYEDQCTLNEQLRLNSALLGDINVLILKLNMSTMVLETAVFIFHAFGAKSVDYIVDMVDIASTIQTIKGGGNKTLVFEVGSNVRKSVENSFDIPEPPRITRSRSGIAQNLSNIQHSHATVGFVDWEWLVQCVISNHIWEPDYFNF
ncbi:uncharacterized protein KQ657_001475 [Scheffersomyces spartinae]|uniref:BRCT domain-containing protein n=1 Tax=Scheffersomyces spartinae TaxID=45513 RepID=A0A9P7V7H9_9ASCO|nr:uncharacterized protein KQ657_001475 [Scheffersomyces spartinae]KAG7192694.1 hypothetical protein KQ657_001475 [Scheffersomyces spartinae]